jgi:starch-binding outer membrane protein, SusD/RagB family
MSGLDQGSTTVTGSRRAAWGALLGVLLLGNVGCDTLLEVELPGQVTDDQLENSNLAATMVVSAVGEFECSVGRQVTSTGILTGEYITSGIFLGLNTWGWRGVVEIKSDAGGCPDSRADATYGYYAPLQSARYLAEDGYRRIEGFDVAEVPSKTEYLATLAAYAGYSYVLLGEGFCEMAIDKGPLMKASEVLARAEQWFTKALQHADEAGNANLRNLALVGRARARLVLGKKAEAAADAARVTVGYVRSATASTAVPRRENYVFHKNNLNRFSSVGPGWRRLTVAGAPDPRVPVGFTGGFGSDGFTEQWDQRKYTSSSSPIRLASWIEAQLIIAEALGGQAAIDAMNRVRATYNLPPVGAGDLATVLEERRREFFSEGKVHGDMVRHGIPFPSGFNHKGQIYQDLTCIPLPDVERLNNPNIGS